MKVAVFGHYDSRGGTSAFPLPDQPTRADVLKACSRYLTDFCWDEVIKGTEDGETWCDPAQHDFLYVADLHGDIPEPQYGDLEEMGSVIRDGEPDEAPYPPEGATRQSFQPMFEEYIDRSIANPVQLEYVPSMYNHDIEVPMDHPLQVRMREVFGDAENRTHVWRSDETPEQKEAHDALNAEFKRLEGAEEARLAGLATKLKNPQHCRWDDDAYGFVLYIREV